MTPPNFCGGAGIWSPWIVVVALGAPGVPVICCASTGPAPNSAVQVNAHPTTSFRTPFIAAPLSASTNQSRDQLGLTGGSCHEPSRIDGAFSFGQYSRIIRTNFPSGAGSQFDSLSGPGESF